MRNEKILVVEFEENSLNTLMTLLEKEGFQVVTAKDGHEGLLKYEAENPDLVILEPMLLKLHGFDLCKKISKDSRKQTPVIITTGFYKGEHYREQALESFGASAFFEKPYDRDELLSTVMSLLGNGAPASQQEKVEPGEPAKPETAVPIEEKVKELEESIKTPEKTSEPGPSPEKGSEQELPDEIDKMLQNTLSEFGIHLDEKKAGAPAAKKAVEAPPVEEEQPEKQVDESRQEEGPSEEPKKEGEEEPQVQEEELKPEQLIAELIQKEETKEKEEEPEEEALAAQEAKQEILPPEEEVPAEKERDVPEAEEKDKADRAIFGEYFDQPKKASLVANLMAALKRTKKPIPVVVVSTAFVVIVAAGATYFFLKPDKPATPKITTSSPAAAVDASGPSSQRANPYGEGQAGPVESGPGEIPGSNPLGDPMFLTEGSPMDASEAAPPEETSEEVLTRTRLTRRRRPVSIPPAFTAPESRPFELVEVEEAVDERISAQNIEISSPHIEETVKKIVQTGEAENRIKTGDLVPIESVDIPPVAIRRAQPKYPPAAYARGIEDTVVIRALISEFGNVLDVAFVRPAKTAPAFNKSCEEAVRQWKFSPAKKDGVNVKVWKTFTIAFKKKTME